MKQISSLIVAFAMFGLIFSIVPQVYAQSSDVETSEQTTLTKDLLNDPLAQEILQKIEESKRRIVQLEQQNYEHLQAQQFLEERRAVALERLNQALVTWEEKWYEYSPEIAYQKFVDKKPSDVQGIYIKQFEFTKSKHNAGVVAKTTALDAGSDSHQAMNEFNKAAKSTVQELHDHNKKIQPDTPSETATKIAIIEGHVNTQNAVYQNHYLSLKGELSTKYHIEAENERNEIRQIIKEYDSGNGMNRHELTEHLGIIREKYNPIKEQILDENSKTLSEFEAKHMEYVQGTLEDINNSNSISSLIEAVWNPDTSSIEIIRK